MYWPPSRPDGPPGATVGRREPPWAAVGRSIAGVVPPACSLAPLLDGVWKMLFFYSFSMEKLLQLAAKHDIKV